MARGISIHIGLNEIDPAHYGTNGRLRGCENDAKSMQEIAAGLGYETTSLLTAEATALNVLRAVSRAAEQLERGDILLLTYAGHGSQVPDLDGDEPGNSKNLDETLCLYDRMLIDDELFRLWTQFRDGVRVVMVSDSCHSGDVLRFIAENKTAFMPLMFGGTTATLGAVGGRDLEEPVFRALPLDDALRAYSRNAERYQEIQASGVRSDRAVVGATVLLLAACQDNQTAGDGREHGVFTAALLSAWDQGRFKGDYKSFFRKITDIFRLVPTQSPNYVVLGAPNPLFESSPPFFIDAARSDVVTGGNAGGQATPAAGAQGNGGLSVEERLARLKALLGGGRAVVGPTIPALPRRSPAPAGTSSSILRGALKKMATTWSWSCSDCGRAETGFNTRQGAESAASAHKREYPSHNPVVGQETSLKTEGGFNMSRGTSIEIDPSVEDRLARLKGARELSPNGYSQDDELPRCKFEIEIPRGTWDKISTSEQEVYRFLQQEGADTLMKAYLNISNVNAPRGGEFNAECKVNEKGNFECKGGVSIRF